MNVREQVEQFFEEGKDTVIVKAIPYIDVEEEDGQVYRVDNLYYGGLILSQKMLEEIANGKPHEESPSE